jgi:dihydrolipoamide dehydrogenase
VRRSTELTGFDYLKHASDYGLTVSSFDKDSCRVQRSRTVASDMSKGVQFLMKKNKNRRYQWFWKTKTR